MDRKQVVEQADWLAKNLLTTHFTDSWNAAMFEVIALDLGVRVNYENTNSFGNLFLMEEIDEIDVRPEHVSLLIKPRYIDAMNQYIYDYMVI